MNKCPYHDQLADKLTEDIDELRSDIREVRETVQNIDKNLAAANNTINLLLGGKLLINGKNGRNGKSENGKDYTNQEAYRQRVTILALEIAKFAVAGGVGGGVVAAIMQNF